MADSLMARAKKPPPPPVGNRVKADQNTKFSKNLTYDVTMTSLLETMGNSDLPGKRQIIYHSRSNDESFAKCNFY